MIRSGADSENRLKFENWSLTSIPPTFILLEKALSFYAIDPLYLHLT